MSTVRNATGAAWEAADLRYTDGGSWTADSVASGPSYVASSAAGQYRGSGQAISATYGVTPAAGDVGVIAVSSNGGARASTPSGWTQSAFIYDSSLQRCRQIFVKALSAAEAGPSITQDVGYTTGQAWCYSSLLVRGASTSSIMNGTPETTYGVAQSVSIGGTIAPDTSPTLLLVILSQGNNTNRTVSEYYEKDPQNVAVLSELNLSMQPVFSQTTAISHHVFVQTWPYAGPVNWRYFYWNTSIDNAAIMLAINPL